MNKPETQSAVSSTQMVRAHRRTFLKAFEKEKKHWRWATMPRETEALVLAFCACVHLRMQGSSMDEVMRSNEKLTDRR